MSLTQTILPVTKARERLGKLAEVQKIYGQTFIDPATLPYTREFSDKEVKEWQEEDQL